MTKLLLILVAFLLAADTTVPAVEPAPTIPPALLAEYYRVDGIVAHMVPAWTAANADLQKTIEEVAKLCGAKHAPLKTGDNHLICAPKPPSEKP